MYNFNNMAIVLLLMATLIISGILAVIAIIVLAASKNKKGPTSILIGVAVCFVLNLITMAVIGENGNNYDDFVVVFLFVLVVVPIGSGIFAYNKIYKAPVRQTEVKHE